MISWYSRSGYQQMVPVGVPTGVMTTNIFVRASTEDQRVVAKLIGKGRVIKSVTAFTTQIWT